MVEQAVSLYDAISEHGPRVRDWSDYDLYSEENKRREHFRSTYAFAVPTREVISAIVEHIGTRKLLEVGAGTGVWARLIADKGVHVTATDDYSWADGKFLPVQHGTHYPVEKLDARDAVFDYPNHLAIMFVWPPYDERMAFDALIDFEGDVVIYVGESEWGCTGDKAFHLLLEVRWELVDTLAIPQWIGLHDSVYLYRRKNAG